MLVVTEGLSTLESSSQESGGWGEEHGEGVQENTWTYPEKEEEQERRLKRRRARIKGTEDREWSLLASTIALSQLSQG